jgi:hypothetical protein
VLGTLGLYVVAQLVLMLVSDRWPPSVENVYWQKWQRLRQVAAGQPERPLLVMLGSSRAEAGFQAGALQDLPGPDGKPFVTYNLGLPACGALHELLLVQQMLREGIRPRLLLVEYVTPLLNQPRRGIICEEYWLAPRRFTLREVQTLQPYLARPDYVWRGWLEARLAPWYDLRGEVQSWAEDHLSGRGEAAEPFPLDGSGYRSLGRVSPEMRLTGQKFTYQKYHKSLRRFEVSAGQARALADLLTCCRREHIPVVLVLMPETPLFHSWYAPAGLAASRRLLARLQSEYDVPVVDATAWLDPPDFADGNHLFTWGAETFTRRLRGELEHVLAAPSQWRR